MTNPLFSICIPAYEDGEAVERAVHSLIKQNFGSWECLIADDSSTDSVKDRVTKIDDPRIRYWRNTPKKGVPANWNSLIREARGTYITLLHQDDFYVSTGVLEEVRKAFQEQAAQFAVCAYSMWKGEDRLGLYDRGEKKIKRFLKGFPQRTLIINRIGHPSVVFFKHTLKNIPFDEGLCFFVDTDWYARLWQAGGRPAYVPKAEVGMERGRKNQLSGKCIQDFAAVDGELEKAFRKWRLSKANQAAGFARLYASHLRHLRFARPALGQRIRSLEPWQRCLFLGWLFPLLGHMGYRALRKFVGMSPWA